MTHWRETTDTEDLGEVAFNAFHKGFSGHVEWDEHTSAHRNLWRAAANAVAEVVATRLAKEARAPSKTRELALDSIRRPVSHDGHGYIVDRENERVAETRGWGRIQYMDRAEERQDAISELLAALINEAEP